MERKLLKVTNITSGDKNGKLFEKITFTEIEDMITIPGSTEVIHILGAESRVRVFDPNRFALGSLVKGEIVEHKTTPYIFNEKEQTKITVVALGKEDSVALANERLQRDGDACVLVNGKRTLAVKATVPATREPEPV